MEMFSAQQKVLPLVGRSLLPPVAPPLDPTKVRLLTRSMSQTAYRSLTTVSYAKTRRDLSLGRSAIAELVDLKVIEPCLDPLFIWPWFMDHQSNGRTRLVVDPSPLSDCVTAEVSVTFDSLEKVVTRIMSSDVIWSCDLRKAYHQTPLLPWFRRFVCIKEEGVVYQFNATLLGFNWAPKMFFYAVLPLTSALAAMGLRTSVYVDDMLGASHPSQALVEVRMAVMAWCFNCWSLNWEKSVLIPQSSLRHCGFEVIVPQMSFGVPADKVRDIRNLALSLWNRETVRRISIAKIVGKVLSIARAFRPSRRITWSLILDLYPREMNFSSLHWGDRVRLSELSREDLLWIHQHLLLPQLTTRSWLPSTTFLVFTDASLWGWGIHIPSLHWFDSGQWSPQEGSLHINVLEVLAVAKGLDQAPPSLCPDRLEGITLVTDNSTARRYINAQGGRRSEDLCFHTFHLLRALEAKSWWIPNAVWIPSRLNLVADLLSRGKPLSPVGARLLYRSILRDHERFSDWLGLNRLLISPGSLASYIWSLRLSKHGRYARAIWSAVKFVLSSLGLWGPSFEDPRLMLCVDATLSVAPSLTRAPRAPFRWTHLLALLRAPQDEFSSRDISLVILSLFCYLRSCESSSLTKGDLSFAPDGGSILVRVRRAKQPAGTRPAFITIRNIPGFEPYDLIKIVHHYVASVHGQYLFPSTKPGPHLSPYGVSQAFAHRMAKMNLGGNWTSHCLRIGAACLAAEMGKSQSEIKALGGWRSDAFLCYIRDLPITFARQPLTPNVGALRS